jgi:hypothetical protein
MFNWIASLKKLLVPLLLFCAPAFAQDHDMGAMNHAMMGMEPMHGLLGAYGQSREGSGTSWQPEAAPHAGFHLADTGDWMVMLHARLLGALDSQSGPRGDSMGFATGMAMGMASRDLANGGTLGFRAMLSLDPFMGRRGYPLLLASGETADDVSHLVDRQHPHDLVMEVSTSYSQPLSQSDSLFLYAGYPGEPALGPGAYMHRPSALDNPMTPISHHWLDSTHIAFGVVTAGWVHEAWKVEVSQFTGREPDQHRFDFDSARFDSTAVRLSFNPDAHWSFQLSAGWLKSPEALDPLENEQRLTASASWYRSFGFGDLAMTLAFGNKHLSGGGSLNAGLAEATWKPDQAWSLFARGETIESGELVPEPGIFSAGALSLGAVRDLRLDDHLKLGLGGLYAFDFAPASALKPYGGGPHGAMAFVRLVLE